MVEVMESVHHPLNMSGYAAVELVRINYFAVREDAVARDEQSVKALEEALDQRENTGTAQLTLS